MIVRDHSARLNALRRASRTEDALNGMRTAAAVTWFLALMAFAGPLTGAKIAAIVASSVAVKLLLVIPQSHWSKRELARIDAEHPIGVPQ